MKTKLCIFMLVLFAGLMSMAQAQIPANISYQGFLSTKDTAFTGNVPASFTLWDAVSGGSQVWNQQSQTVPVNKGYYSVMLNFSINWQNGNANFNKQYWLEVLINGNLLSPRVQLASVPSAFNAKIADSAIHIPQAPVGTIVAYGGNIFKLSQNEKNLGWYICDGRRVSVNDFPTYADVVQSTYGTSDAADSVYLPDFRGMFLRGVNSGFNGNRTDTFADPDAKQRLAMNPNGSGNTGNSVGSVQSDQFKSHNHNLVTAWPINTANMAGNTPRPAWTTSSGGLGTIPDQGGSETRPKNAYVYWIIKVR